MRRAALFKVMVACTLALICGAKTAIADAVAVVSSKSAIITVSKVELGDIFLGKSNQLRGGVKAVPIDLEEGSSTRDDFYRRLTGKSAAQLKTYWTKVIFTGRGEPPREAPNSAAMKKLILENSAAIGYLEANLVDASLRVVTVVGE
jgi:hypothetical protein